MTEGKVEHVQLGMQLDELHVATLGTRTDENQTSIPSADPLPAKTPQTALAQTFARASPAFTQMRWEAFAITYSGDA